MFFGILVRPFPVRKLAHRLPLSRPVDPVAHRLTHTRPVLRLRWLRSADGRARGHWGSVAEPRD